MSILKEIYEYKIDFVSNQKEITPQSKIESKLNINNINFPFFEKLNNQIMIPDLKIGDAVLFNFKIVHGASGNNSTDRRRAFSMRFIGDDVKYLGRGGETSPPFKGIGLKDGEVMRKDWFPIVWTS